MIRIPSRVPNPLLAENLPSEQGLKHALPRGDPAHAPALAENLPSEQGLKPCWLWVGAHWIMGSLRIFHQNKD